MLYVCVFFVATHTIYSPTFHPSPPPPPPPPLFPPVKWTVKEFDCNLTRSIVELIDREADLLNRGRAESSLDGLRKRLLNLFLQFIETPEFNPEVREEEKRRETEQQGWGHTKPHNTTSCVVCECGHFMLNSYVSPSPLFSDLVFLCFFLLIPPPRRHVFRRFPRTCRGARTYNQSTTRNHGRRTQWLHGDGYPTRVNDVEWLGQVAGTGALETLSYRSLFGQKPPLLAKHGKTNCNMRKKVLYREKQEVGSIFRIRRSLVAASGRQTGPLKDR